MHSSLGSVAATIPIDLRSPLTPESSVNRSQLGPDYLVSKYGKLHHAFPRTLAPYPVNYEKSVVDADALDLAFRLQVMGGSPSIIPVFDLEAPKTHPRRCLDIGCGSGDWILAAARAWPLSSFVGLDLVVHQIPVHLLDELTGASRAVSTEAPSGSLAPSGNPTTAPIHSRINWVQSNFLRPLPFADGEFDYVHVSGIARGVPEDKWDGLLAEINRVLAVNGHLEIIEEDIIFPILPSESVSPVNAKPILNDTESSTEDTKYRPRKSFSGLMPRDIEDVSRRTSLSAPRLVPASSPKTTSPIPPLRLITNLSQHSLSTSSDSSERLSTSQSPTKLFNGLGGVLVAGPCSPMSFPAKRDNNPAIPVGWDGPPEPSPELTPSHSSRSSKSLRRARTASSLASSIMALSNKSLPSQSSLKSRRLSAGLPSSSRSKNRGNQFEMSSTRAPAVPPLPPHLRSGPNLSMSRITDNKPTSIQPEILPEVPPIKHEHQLLHTLFYGVFERRFINTTPTSILPSLLDSHFQSVCVSPPIDFPTPPPPPKSREVQRREKRNTSQRECGSAGLEFSQSISMNISRPLVEVSCGDLEKEATRLTQMRNLSRPAEPAPMVYKGHPYATASPNGDSGLFSLPPQPPCQLRKSRSSPGIASQSSESASSRDSFPSFMYSGISRPNDSPSSRNTSLLPTPVSTHAFESRLKSLGEGSRDDHGMDEFGLVQDFSHFLWPKSNEHNSQVREEEEEEAKFAIVGEGGCFTTSTSSDTGTRTLSHHPSLSSVQKSSDSDTMGQTSQWYEDDDDMLEMLTRVDVTHEEDTDIEGFDHVGAEELGVFNGVFDSEEQPTPDIWEQPTVEDRNRVYVRPRTTFTGRGMALPESLWELDDLSMGVHLTRSWINVVACKEAMWDELQRRVKTTRSSVRDIGVSRVSQMHPCRRSTLLDELEWVGSEKLLSDREKFELLFSRFEDDMRHWAAVGSSVPSRLAWLDPSQRSPGNIPPDHTKNMASLRRPSYGSGNGSQILYSSDDGRGPGHNGLIIPGVDMCRTLRVFTARKIENSLPTSSNATKIVTTTF